MLNFYLPILNKGLPLPVNNLAIDNQDTALRCAALRNKLNLSMPEIAKFFGIAWATWSRWEKGKTRPNQLALQKIEELEKTAEAQFPPPTIAEKCQAIRTKLKANYTQMAEKFDIQIHTWSAWENGTRTPHPVERQRIDELYKELTALTGQEVVN